RTIWTRQCAGIIAGGCAGAAGAPPRAASPRGAPPRAPRAPPPPRGGAGPSGTKSAAVIVACFNSTDFKFSQGDAANAPTSSKAMLLTIVASWVFNGPQAITQPEVVPFFVK